MTEISTWASEDPEASAGPGAAAGTPGVYSNRLGAVVVPGRDVPKVSLRFKAGVLNMVVERAADSNVDDFAETVGKRLKRRGFAIEKPYPVQFAGFADARGRSVMKKKKGRIPAGDPLTQLYAVPGPYSLTLTVTAEHDHLIAGYGPFTIYPADPPAIVPIVRLGVPNVSGVTERVILTEPKAKLTAMITRDPVTESSDQFAASTLQTIMGKLRTAVVNEGEPDMFLGGQYCIRNTFVTGGTQTGSSVRSEFRWAGVVAGHGIQIFVTATKSIIDLDFARGMKDAVVLIPSG